MPGSRLELLRSMVAQDNGNAFARYGLAMEYKNTGDLEGAISEFRDLLRQDPGYAAAYFHGGQTLEKLGRIDEARDMYRRGVEVTHASGDAHAQSEMEAALQLLG